MPTATAAVQTDQHGFPVTACTRCSGTGRHSYCQRFGDTCFKCGGSGLQHKGKKVAEAAAAFQAAVRKARECTPGELVPGDRYRVNMAKGAPYCASPVASIAVDYTRVTGARLSPKPVIFTSWMVIVTHEDGTVAEIGGSQLVRRVASPVDPAPFVAAATARAPRRTAA